MEEKNYLTEAFQALKDLDLNEDVFDITNAGIEQANDFVKETEVDEFEDIIDPLAQTEEELQDSYLGKAILDCEVCHSKLYKDPEEVVIDEEAQLANIEEACPYCQSNEGFKIIGQVAEYCPHCEDEDEDEEHTDIEIDTEEKEVETEPEEEIDESIKTRKGMRKISSLKEEDKPAAISIEDAQKWVDYDMKKYGRISGRTNRLVKKAGFQIIKDDHGDYEVAAGKFESVNEEVEKVDIETESDRVTMEQDENGKVVVTTEPKETVEAEETAEVIAPVEPETEEKFEVEGEDDFEDVDFDEFEETDFDTLGEKYLKRVYENVKSFKTTKGSLKGNKLQLEGLITFKSGKEAKTNFIFEAHTISKTGKLKFLGENKQFAKGKKSFTLTGHKQGNKLMMESLTYNYQGRDSITNKTQKVYGRVSR